MSLHIDLYLRHIHKVVDMGFKTFLKSPILLLNRSTRHFDSLVGFCMTSLYDFNSSTYNTDQAWIIKLVKVCLIEVPVPNQESEITSSSIPQVTQICKPGGQVFYVS